MQALEAHTMPKWLLRPTHAKRDSPAGVPEGSQAQSGNKFDAFNQEYLADAAAMSRAIDQNIKCARAVHVNSRLNFRAPAQIL